MPTAQLNTGMDMHYEIEGSGEPLLLIMGTAADHAVWSSQVPAYSSQYKVITYDARGTGRSTKTDASETYSMRALADDAAALLDQLELESVHVSGLSLGSTTAQELALRHPEKVRTLQLHCTWARTDEWLLRLFQSLEPLVEQEEMETYIRTISLWVASPEYINNHTAAVEEFEADFLLRNPYRPSISGMLGHLHADKYHDAFERLHLIDVPTLITSGEVDMQVPARYGREVADLIDGSRFHLFGGAYSSHQAFNEMADEWNEFTLDWLNEAARLTSG